MRASEITAKALNWALKGLPQMFNSLFWWLFSRVAGVLDRSLGWHKLPLVLGVLTLAGLRKRLRDRNLYDTSSVPTAPRGTSAKRTEPASVDYLATRTADGTYNDLGNPMMGSHNTRFGRNVPLEYTAPENDWAILNSPNPRIVSRELLTRDVFRPAETLNLLAAAWIQFMVRDWFSHGEGTMTDSWKVKLLEDDRWPEGEAQTTESMEIPRTLEDPTRSPEDPSPPTYLNTQTHWWDGSQIYGSDKTTQDSLRLGSEGKLKEGFGDLPPMRADGKKHPVDEPGFWLGLAMMGVLFTKEHNAICDYLRSHYPHWTDEELFERARLVTVALMAKIHTVEWTPAILGHPTLQVAMSANWWGLAGERIHKLLGRISESEVISGIPGSQKNHFGVPYSMTEEFVAVYRMHPLIPDEYTFRSAETDEVLQRQQFGQLVNRQAINLMEDREHLQNPLQNLFYSFGIAHPGAITLHNYPRSLQQFERLRPPEESEGLQPRDRGAREEEPPRLLQDLGTTDILRSRELGLPRYNQFRKLLHRPPVSSFEELTDNPVWAEELRRVYNNDVDQVDLMIGLFAEPKPKGFGFSDTAFRIFILMASRRLNSDRFFTTHYTPEVYTQAGLDWIDDNDMRTVLLRHFPGLRPSLRGVKNAFAPWPRIRP